MPQDAACPQCQTAFPVTESRTAVTVACPKCDAEMTVEFKRPVTPPEAGQPPYDLLVRPGALVADPVPGGPRRRHDIDEDEEGTRNTGGSATVVVVSGVLGLLFVLGGLGLTAWVLFDVIDTTPTTTSSRTQSNTNTSQSKGGQNKGGKPDQPNPAPKQPNPFNPSSAGPPKTEFELRPTAGPNIAVTPPPLGAEGRREIPLPGPVDKVAPGGNGRYLFLLLQSRELACVDVSTGAVTRGPQTDAFGGHPIAAGLTRGAVVALDRTVHVYELPTLRRLYTARTPLFHGGDLLAMGASTNGPLLVSDPFGEVVLMELTDAEARPVEGSQAATTGATGPFRASANGRLFVRGTYDADGSAALLTESGRRWKTTLANLPCAAPSADGRFALGNGLIVRDGGQTVGTPAGRGVWYVPAVTGNHFLRLAESRTAGRSVTTASVHRNHVTAERDKLATVVPELPELDGLLDGASGRAGPLDQHLFLLPDAKLLVTLNMSRDKLTLRKVEIR